jgi:hypothetical protein
MSGRGSLDQSGDTTPKMDGEDKLRKGGCDPVPIWNGKDPATRWKRVRRELDLWIMDYDLPAEKKGVTVFRSLTEDARTLAEKLTHAELRQSDGAENMMKYFDEAYKGLFACDVVGVFEAALYEAGAQQKDENFISYCAREKIEFDKCVLNEGVAISIELQGMIVMKFAKLTPAQRTMMLHWTQGNEASSYAAPELVSQTSSRSCLAILLRSLHLH